MTAQFDITMHALTQARALPGAWTDAHYRRLLQMLEFEDADAVTADELPEMAVMALQDLAKPEQAGDVILALVLGDAAGAGLRQQLAHELTEAQPWEEQGDLARHRPLFVAQWLLHQAFPRAVPAPTIARLVFTATARDPAATAALQREPTAALVARLLAAGMADHAALRRLFAPSLRTDPFPEAPSIIWQMESEPLEKSDGHPSRRITAFAPRGWVEPLQGVQSYRATVTA